MLPSELQSNHERSRSTYAMEDLLSRIPVSYWTDLASQLKETNRALLGGSLGRWPLHLRYGNERKISKKDVVERLLMCTDIGKSLAYKIAKQVCRQNDRDGKFYFDSQLYNRWLQEQYRLDQENARKAGKAYLTKLFIRLGLNRNIAYQMTKKVYKLTAKRTGTSTFFS